VIKMMNEIRKKMDEEALGKNKPKSGGLVLIIGTGKKPTKGDSDKDKASLCE
tara:strand:- start:1763 stop:1918 length:156 start_codon:yes stop_codon:yes gene_type:complete